MTDLEAANKALILLGVNQIGSLNDATAAARTVSRAMASAKLAVLSEFAWSFALKMVNLARSNAPPPPGFAYSFAVPADCENVIQAYRGVVFGESHARPAAAPVKIHFVLQNGVIAANETPAALEYTYRNTNIASWSDAAAEALAARLAADCAAALAGGQQTGQVLLQRYQYLISNARQKSAAAENLPAPPATHYIDSRR